MHCPKCGQETPADSTFCPGCGTRLSGAAEASHADVPSGTQRVVAAGRGKGGSPAEEDIWAGAYSAKAMVGSFAAAAVLTLIGLIVGALVPPALVAIVPAAIIVWCGLGLMYLYRRMTVRYRLSTYRFFHDTGLLSRVGNRVEVIDIDDVTVRQNLLERMFDVGTIRIASSDKTHPELCLAGIEEPKRVADLVDGARRAERQRRGLHLDSALSTD